MIKLHEFILFSPHILSKPTIDIVLPCFNPLANWVDTVIERVGEIQSRLPDFDFHCIVVNDGSSQNVDDKDAARLSAVLPDFQWISYAQNRGKGYALRQGITKAKSDVVLYTDIDLPYKMDSMLDCLIQVVDGKADLSVAIRNESYYKRLPARRRYLSKALRSLNRMLLGLKTSDTQGGLKVFNSKGRSHFLATTIDRYLFDLEFVYLCSRDKDVVVLPVESDMRDTIELSKFPLSVLRNEGMNFLKLITIGRRRK